MDTIKILLVDDHKMIRDSLKLYLSDKKKYEVVAEAADGHEALQKLEKHSIDIVLTDILMPGMDGISLTKEVKELYPKQKVLALTMLGETQHIKQMLSNGATGYLLKNCGEDEIKRAIDTVNNGGTYFSPEVTNSIMDNLRGVKKNKSSLTMDIPLTSREKQVLNLIIKEYTNQEIADKLFISMRTVDAHKRNLLEKTGAKNTAGLVVYAYEKKIVSNI